MKKCPQCGREYDTSMMFCLDDGAELLYGPASEPSIYASLGNNDKAFEWLEIAFHNKEDFGFFRWRVHFESLREDPRFNDLLKRMNLPN